ncbi:selenium cofactor biosynthesis protein YqeC [Thermodesulfobacteriota bacterium]
MQLYNALQISPDVPELICLVGGGGKTTAMFRLASELKALGRRVLVTTTTSIIVPDEDQCDRCIQLETQDAAELSSSAPGSILCLGGGLTDNGLKFRSVAPGVVDLLFREKRFDYILVEADGARRKPIKAPAGHEPVLPSRTTLTVGVIGLDALGTAISDDTVHRPELFCSLTGKALGERIEAADIIALTHAPEGLFKGVPDGCRQQVLLNKAENEARRSAARTIAAALRGPGSRPAPGVIIASLARSRTYAAAE